jgi:hypothetical protein
MIEGFIEFADRALHLAKKMVEIVVVLDKVNEYNLLHYK